MLHEDHLLITRQLPQLRAHDLSAPATDARVDLVEDQRGSGVRRREDGFQGQHQARCFTTRGDFCQWFERLARVGSDEKLHAVDTGGVAGIILFSLTVDTGRYTVLIGGWLDLDGETRRLDV